MINNYFKHLNITELEEKWGLYVTTIGFSKIDPNQNYPNSEEHPQSHILTWNRGRILHDYYMIFISKGEGIFESASTPPSTVTAGTCFFLFPEIWHRYKPNLKSGWEEFWVGFNGFYPDE